MPDFWNYAEVFDSSGTLTLQRQPDGSDLMYCSRVEPDAAAVREHGAKRLTDEEHQAWINLIVAAPKLFKVLAQLMAMRSKCFIPNDGDWWDKAAREALAIVNGEQP